MNMKPTQEMTFLIGRTKILALLPFQDLGGQYVPIFGLISKVHLQWIKCVRFVTLFPTRLCGRDNFDSSQPITVEPLTNNTQSNQTNKKRKNSSEICLSFSRYTSNILKVNFDELRV